ncbi:MAG TPA: hypothetical protein VGM21_20740 [Actinomycetota bacterium]
MSFNSFDPLGDEDWAGTRSSRPNVRRMWFAVLVLVVILIGLWWLIFRGLFQGDRLTKVPTPHTTVAAPSQSSPATGFSAADQRVIGGAQRALTAWGDFAVTGDLAKLDDTFWKEGPQREELAKEASGLKSKHLGSPPYKFALAPSRVLGAPEGQKIVRGTVKVSRPGEQEQTFQWDVYMRKVPGSNPERWRLWTVADTPK